MKGRKFSARMFPSIVFGKPGAGPVDLVGPEFQPATMRGNGGEEAAVAGEVGGNGIVAGTLEVAAVG